jgi:hypothetical protein
MSFIANAVYISCLQDLSPGKVSAVNNVTSFFFFFFLFSFLNLETECRHE